MDVNRGDEVSELWDHPHEESAVPNRRSSARLESREPRSNCRTLLFEARQAGLLFSYFYQNLFLIPLLHDFGRSSVSTSTGCDTAGWISRRLAPE